jgi:hypothetical protein
VDETAVGLRKDFDRVNALIAIIVALISFIVYRLTVAHTLSYWDCGEFIACAHILGNPHPPGSPLFIVIGRFFDLLPLGNDVAFRINLLSVFSSTFSTVFAYLVIVRLVSSWYTGKESHKLGRLIAYGSGFTGALFMAFGQTNWNNSVETEVYGLAMLMMLAILWLGLKWFDHRYDSTGQRIVLLVALISMMSVGVHLTVYLIVPIVAIFFSLKRGATPFDWGLVAGFFIFELLMIFVLSGSLDNYNIFLALTAVVFGGLVFYLRKKVNWPILLSFAALSPIMIGFKPFLYSVILWTIVAGVVWFVKQSKLWRLATLIMVVGAIGFSVHAYIPFRSMNHPIIDENTPSRSFKTFVNFLDRAQYGSTSMTKRMFVRRGAWENQFGDHARMGFLRFFKGQYSNEKIFPLFLIIGIFGMAMMAYKNPSWGSIFVALVLVAAVGLVLYMNFADGTHYNQATGDAYQEVRDRDYFFTPAFVLFGMAIGIGMGGIMELIRKGTKKMGAGKNRLAVFASLALVLTPIVPIQANYFTNDRSTNRMAFNYAYNILNSCEKNAILFTSGDNDTFPIWCIQEIYGIRQDIRVANFSLLNTDWYSWQLSNMDLLSAINAGYDLDSLATVAEAAVSIDKGGELIAPSEFVDSQSDKKIRAYLQKLADQDELPPGIRQRVPISFTDDQILWEDTVIQRQTIPRPRKPFYDPIRKRNSWLYPTMYDNRPLRVAMMMMENIILTNKWKHPIYFTSLSGNVRETPLNLTERLVREGVVYKLTPEIRNLTYNEEITEELFFEKYRFDNLSDTLVAQNENASGISLAYPEKMLEYQSFISRKGDTARSDSLLNKICEKIPSYWRTRLAQRDMYYRAGDSARGKESEEEMLAYMHGFRNMNPDNIFFYQYLGMGYFAMGNKEKSEEYLNKAWEMNIDKEHTFRALLTLYAEQRRPVDMGRVARDYLRYHEQDPIANEVIRNVQMLMQSQSQPQMPTTPPIQIQPTQPPPQTPPETDEGGG